MAVWLTMSLSQGTPNETARTNTVTATVTVHYSQGSYNGSSPSGTLTINGQSYSFTCNFNYAGIGQGAVTTGTGSVVAATRTVTVSYGSSTTKTVSASASFNSGTASGTVSTSGSISLTPISAGGSSGGGGDDGGDDGGEEWDPDNPGGSGGITGNTGNCTIIGGTLFYSETESLNYYLNTTFTVTSYDYIPYVYVLKFTTPSDVGYSHSLAVNLSGTKSYVYDEGDYRICYALCESDENHNMYLRATSIVNDPTQLASGSLSNREWFSMPFTIETNELQSNEEYYLIFWIPSDTGFVASADADPTAYHGVTLNYTSGGTEGGDGEGEEYRYLWIKDEEGLKVTLHRYDSSGDAYIDISDDSNDGWNDSGLWHVFIMRSGDYFRFSLEALPGYTLGEIITSGVQYNENRLDWSFDPNLTDNAYVTATVTNDNAGGGGDEPDNPGGGDDIVTPSARGVFYIDNGSEFAEYECYIDTGTDWFLIGGSSVQRDSNTFNTDSSGNVTIDCGFKPDALYITRGELFGGNLQSACIAFTEAGRNTLESCLMNDTMVVRCVASRTETGAEVSMTYYSGSWWPFVRDDNTLSYIAIKYT